MNLRSTHDLNIFIPTSVSVTSRPTIMAETMMLNMTFVWVALGILAAALPAQSQDVPPFTDKYCRTDAYPPPEKDRVPSFVLNLDLEPEARWADLVKPKAKEISFLIQDIKGVLGLLIDEKTVTEIIDTLFAPVVDMMNENYKRELQGISNATGISIGEVVMYNVFYEVQQLCTAIVTQDQNGNIYHARNMDFGALFGWNITSDTWILTERLRPLLTNVEYQKGGKTVARGIHFAGYVGMLTGLKPGVVSLNINSRHKLGQYGLIGFIKSILANRTAHWTGFVLRDAVVEATDFESAVNHLATVELLVPSYIIMGGVKPGEGAVLTRSQGNVCADIQRLDASKGKWFLVQTNYDNWESPPFYDDRRDPAIKCVKNMTQTDVGYKGVFNVLSTKPVLNGASTFTGLMHAQDGTLDAYLRYCPEPCYPW